MIRQVKRGRREGQWVGALVSPKSLPIPWTVTDRWVCPNFVGGQAAWRISSQAWFHSFFPPNPRFAGTRWRSSPYASSAAPALASPPDALTPALHRSTPMGTLLLGTQVSHSSARSRK